MDIENISEIDLDKLTYEEKIKVKKLLKERKIKKARKSPNDFMEYVMRDESDNPIEQGDIHKEWQNLLHTNEHSNVILIAPRDHGKTTQIVGYTLFKIGKNPNIRIKIVCNNDDEAKARVGAIKEYIEDSKEYREVFPHIEKSEKNWTKHSITVQRDSKSKDPTLESASIMGGGTGGRADLIIYDDIVDEKNAIQHPKDRETVKRKKRNVWDNILEPDGEEVYIGTRWHEDDLTGELMESDAYEVGFYAIDKDFTPIWPEKWSRDDLKQRREKIGARAFDRGFRNIPLSLDEQLFDDTALSRLQENFDPMDYLDCPTYMGVDLARGTGSRASRTVITVVAVPEKNKRVVLDIRLGKWESKKVVDEIVHIWDYYNIEYIYIENNSMQQMLVNWLENLSDQNHYDLKNRLEGVFTGKEKADLDVGVPALADEMKQGRWIMDYDREYHKENCGKKLCPECTFYEELKTYPIGKSDDTVMSAWITMKCVWDKAQSQNNVRNQMKNIKEFMRREGSDISLKGVRDSSVFN